MEPLQCSELRLCPLKILSLELTEGTSTLLTSALITAHRGEPRPNIIGVMCNSILSIPSCFDKAGGRLKIISYVKYDLLSMYSCIPGEYLLISSICSVQTFLKSLNAVWLLSLIFPSISVTERCWDTLIATACYSVPSLGNPSCARFLCIPAVVS